MRFTAAHVASAFCFIHLHLCEAQLVHVLLPTQKGVGLATAAGMYFGMTWWVRRA